MKVQEHSVGDFFVVDHLIYKVCLSDDYCFGCSLYIESEGLCYDDVFHRFECCDGEHRVDGNDVIFALVGVD